MKYTAVHVHISFSVQHNVILLDTTLNNPWNQPVDSAVPFASKLALPEARQSRQSPTPFYWFLCTVSVCDLEVCRSSPACSVVSPLWSA